QKMSRTLLDPTVGTVKQVALHYASSEELLDQRQEATVGYPSCEQGHQDGLMQTIEGRSDIALNDPEVLTALIEVAVEQGETIHRSASRAKAIGAVEEIALPNRLEYHLEEHLYDAIFEGRDAKRSCAAIAFRDSDPAHRGGAVAANPQLLLYLL